MKYTGQTEGPLKIRFQEHFRDFEVWEQQVEIRPAPLRKQTCIRHIGRYNGHRPRNQQKQNDGHIRKILHLQRDKIQQPNQRQADRPNAIFETLIHEASYRGHSDSW